MLGVPKDCLCEARGEHVTRERPRQTHEWKTRSFPKRQRSSYITIPWWKNFWISNRFPANMAEKTDFRFPANMAEKRKRKNDMHAVFPVHDCTQEQNSSPYLASTVRQCKWPSLSRSWNSANQFRLAITRLAFLQDKCRHSVHIFCDYRCDFCLKSQFLSAEV